MDLGVLPYVVLLVGGIYAGVFMDELEDSFPYLGKAITTLLQLVVVVVWYVYLANLLGF